MRKFALILSVAVIVVAASVLLNGVTIAVAGPQPELAVFPESGATPPTARPASPLGWEEVGGPPKHPKKSKKKHDDDDHHDHGDGE